MRRLTHTLFDQQQAVTIQQPKDQPENRKTTTTKAPKQNETTRTTKNQTTQLNEI